MNLIVALLAVALAITACVVVWVLAVKLRHLSRFCGALFNHRGDLKENIWLCGVCGIPEEAMFMQRIPYPDSVPKHSDGSHRTRLVHRQCVCMTDADRRRKQT
jgi:hypothetical protein